MKHENPLRFPIWKIIPKLPEIKKRKGTFCFYKNIFWIIIALKKHFSAQWNKKRKSSRYHRASMTMKHFIIKQMHKYIIRRYN